MKMLLWDMLNPKGDPAVSNGAITKGGKTCCAAFVHGTEPSKRPRFLYTISCFLLHSCTCLNSDLNLRYVSLLEDCNLLVR